MSDAVYTVHLVVRAEHTRGPEPEWQTVANALARVLADEEVLFSVDTGSASFAGCRVRVKQCQIDEARDG